MEIASNYAFQYVNNKKMNFFSKAWFVIALLYLTYNYSVIPLRFLFKQHMLK